ncbi:MAG: L,D-transpeptidase family protein [Alphaproteobacteria bacterium]|nr:L,D-transpeptidase family protein [Alphaproteobacteria bacterium]
MPRIKALSALAILAVLISAGSVGSQDPYRARSDAESAEFAQPISAPEEGSSYNSYQVTDPAAVQVPAPITPGSDSAVVEPLPVEPIASVVQPEQPVAAIERAPNVHLAAVTTPAAPTPEVTATEDAPLVSAAERRLFATVPEEIEGYFDLFMYVSKSSRGPLGQRMFVFQRDADGKVLPYAEWRVSTGREKVEMHHEKRIRTTTPEGIFMLDADRFHERYWSRTWDNAPMHYAMFYDLKNNGNASGLAIHAAMGKNKVRRLGKRDSAGCVRLSPANAKELFFKIKNTTKGRVPSFAVNENGSTDRWGKVEKTADGTLMLQDGYRAVLLVENFDGRDEVVGPVVAYTN